MYTCGPTVYDYAHVGNFRAFLTYDVLKRALTYFGHNVDHICNLTDVDDKIIARCTREDMSLLDLTRKFEGKFMDDLMALNIVPAREYPRATEHIDEMVCLIQELEAKGLAYQSEEGSWYFNVAAKEGYGQQLVNLDVGNMKKGASGELLSLAIQCGTVLSLVPGPDASPRDVQRCIEIGEQLGS